MEGEGRRGLGGGGGEERLSWRGEGRRGLGGGGRGMGRNQFAAACPSCLPRFEINSAQNVLSTIFSKKIFLEFFKLGFGNTFVF